MQAKSASYIAGCTRTEIQTKEKREKKYLNIKATATWKEMADKEFEKDKRKKKGNLDK